MWRRAERANEPSSSQGDDANKGAENAEKKTRLDASLTSSLSPRAVSPTKRDPTPDAGARSAVAPRAATAATAAAALTKTDGRSLVAPRPEPAFDGAGLEGLDFEGHDRFFVIKSYTEDDVHKSVKYGCWTSTSTGNARLDAAFSTKTDDEDRRRASEEERDIFGCAAERADAAFLELASKAERALARRRRREGDATTDRPTERADGDSPERSSPRSANTPRVSPDGDFDDDAFLPSPSDRADDATARRPHMPETSKKAQWEARGEGSEEAGEEARVSPRDDDDARGVSPNAPNAPNVVPREETGPVERVVPSRRITRRPRVILFFSVNSSGHFCGVAEMTGAVDHDARADFWQRDKWPGCFDVDWHYVKDVPNAALRHIRLVESDRKPVTNARDAQEIAPNQARLVLNVFRNFKSQTSLLDDFEFYGAREKARADIRSGRGVRRGGTGGGAFPYAREKRNATPRNVSFRQKPGSRGASIFGGGGGVAFPYAAGPTAYPRGGVPYVAAPAPPAPFPFPAASAMSAVSAMSASAPAFAPVGLSRVALSAHAGHAHPPRGAGVAGAPRNPPGDPELPPARPERAPEASPYRDAVGAR